MYHTWLKLCRKVYKTSDLHIYIYRFEIESYTILMDTLLCLTPCNFSNFTHYLWSWESRDRRTRLETGTEARQVVWYRHRATWMLHFIDQTVDDTLLWLHRKTTFGPAALTLACYVAFIGRFTMHPHSRVALLHRQDEGHRRRKKI